MPLVFDDKGVGTLVLKFGGGVNARESEAGINEAECAEGQNFELDFENKQFKNRKAVEQVATATNAGSVRGYVQHEKGDGTRSVLIQAGPNVYEWDGTASGFTLVQVIDQAAKLRGKIESNSPKDDKNIIADLALKENVKTWNGTTFEDLTTDLGVSLKARYTAVELDRGIVASVQTGTSAETKHIFAVSDREDIEKWDTGSRPSSALGAGAAFYLPMPNLRPIAGITKALGALVFPTRRGPFYQLAGVNSTDHRLDIFHSAQGGLGEEEVAFVGNDIVFAKPGAIDSLGGTEAFGDVETDDLSRWIQPLIKDVRTFVVDFSPEHQKVYCFPKNGGEIYVLNKSILDEKIRARRTGELGTSGAPRISPWSIWKTDADFNFDPTCVMRLYRPTDNLEFIYLGGPNGELFQLESGKGGDPGSNDIEVTRVSRVFEVPPAQVYEISGWVKYKKAFGATLTLTFQYGGEQVFDQSVTVTLDAASNAPVFNGNFYFNNNTYFSTSFKKRLARKQFTPPGQEVQFQIKATVDGSADFAIEEIGVQFRPTS